MESWVLVRLGMVLVLILASALLITLYKIVNRSIGKFKAKRKVVER